MTMCGEVLILRPISFSRLSAMGTNCFWPVAGIRNCYISYPSQFNADIRMSKTVKRKKIKASVKPLRAVPRLPAGKWTSTLDS